MPTVQTASGFASSAFMQICISYCRLERNGNEESSKRQRRKGHYSQIAEYDKLTKNNSYGLGIEISDTVFNVYLPSEAMTELRTRRHLLPLLSIRPLFVVTWLMTKQYLSANWRSDCESKHMAHDNHGLSRKFS